MSVVFITGATRNTGRAIAEKFAAIGYDVAVSGRDVTDAEAVADELSQKYGVKAKGYGVELSDLKSVNAAFEDITTTFNGLDIFVANAANLGVDFGVLNSSEDDFDSVIDANVKGTFFCCQNAAKIMKAQGKGSIVVVGSVHCHQAIHGRALYTMSKGALLSLTKSMAVELGAYGIRANYLAAGAIHTDRWDGQTEEETVRRRAQYPAGIESFGEDIAEAVYYLGSDLSRTVTGTELTVDSGISICLLPFKKPADFDEK
jgi:3-oxoacyl-[acyl-carrier protein] reductase